MHSWCIHGAFMVHSWCIHLRWGLTSPQMHDDTLNSATPLINTRKERKNFDLADYIPQDCYSICQNKPNHLTNGLLSYQEMRLGFFNLIWALIQSIEWEKESI